MVPLAPQALEVEVAAAAELPGLWPASQQALAKVEVAAAAEAVQVSLEPLVQQRELVLFSPPAPHQ